MLESDAAQEAFERTLSSPAVERAAVKVLDSQLVDSVWDHLLASDEVQKLVQRIAESPEVRAAITSQGVGLIADLGRQLREIADHVDLAIDHVVERLRGRRVAEATDVNHVGLFTRAVGAAIDGALLNLRFLAVSAMFGITIGGVLGDDQSPSGGEFAARARRSGAQPGPSTWARSGRSPGRRSGCAFSRSASTPAAKSRIGARRAIRRLFGTVLSVLTLGIGFAMISFDPQRRSLADRLAGTEVIEADRDSAAPWSAAVSQPARSLSGAE